MGVFPRDQLKEERNIQAWFLDELAKNVDANWKQTATSTTAQGNPNRHLKRHPLETLLMDGPLAIHFLWNSMGGGNLYDSFSSEFWIPGRLLTEKEVLNIYLFEWMSQLNNTH